jgi:transcriptional regulator with XRE-family HTH domain
MENFQFAQTLLMKRQELHLTQEDIAKYVGVTRAAVSKWEKGLSYPDITLLPKLATFFNVSIDTLLGYEPQMTKERIEQLYMEYAEKFATEPFEEVEKQLEQIKNEYYSCYPLLLKIVQLYMNYIPRAEQREEALQNAFNLAERVRMHAPHVSLVKEATGMQSLIHLMRGNAEAVLELLGAEPDLDYGDELVIITAHTMLGNVEMAKEISQISMFQKLFAFVSLSVESLQLHLDRPQFFEQTVERIEVILNVYNIPALQPNVAFIFYFKAASGYMMLQQQEKAIAMLEKYVDTCEKCVFPLSLKGDEYFYLLNSWIHRHGQIMMQAPRDEQSIKNDLVKEIESNPVFAPLQNEVAYQQLIEKLKRILQ